jgi:hypothetical protein
MAKLDFKELARLILQASADVSNLSKDDNHADRQEQVYAELAGSETDGYILSLLTHWANDLVSVFSTAEHIRLTIELVDGKWVVMDVPDPVIAPDKELSDYHWFCGTYEWQPHLEDYAYVPGHWGGLYLKELTNER